MRFIHLVFPATASLVLIAGCGDSSVPTPPDGAWYIQTTQDDPTVCKIAGHNDQLGTVNQSEITKTLKDGSDGASIDCSVIGSSTFKVNALTSYKDLSMNIDIPSITAKATKDSPAKGQVQYASSKTVSVYAGDCDFFFEDGELATKGGPLSAGKIWVSFSCAKIGNASNQSYCSAPTGYLVLQNCDTEQLQ